MIDERSIFVTGTHTGIGKTLVSALLLKLLAADYWKPVQCGDLTNSDTSTVRQLVGHDHPGIFHPERYALQLPQSVHIAAAAEQKTVKLNDFTRPQSSNRLIIEGAGGCLVPLNQTDVMIDLATHLQAPVILVTRYYLGAYNHTLLSLEALQARGVKILGLVLNGGEAPEFCEFISKKTGLPFLGIIAQLANVSSQTIESLAQEWRGKANDRPVTKGPQPDLASVYAAQN